MFLRYGENQVTTVCLACAATRRNKMVSTIWLCLHSVHLLPSTDQKQKIHNFSSVFRAFPLFEYSTSRNYSFYLSVEWVKYESSNHNSGFDGFRDNIGDWTRMQTTRVPRDFNVSPILFRRQVNFQFEIRIIILL